MNNWKTVKEIFHEALRRDGEEREKFLRSICGDNVGLRIEVESLLISLSEATDFLERPLVAPPLAGERLTPGQTISHYKIVSHIATGGMGEVYLAEDEKLRRQVALKVLPEEVLDDVNRLRRFQREAEAVSALNHPNILTIFDFDTDNGVHLFAAEYVKGVTLREKLDGGNIPIDEALDISIQIASALSAAHDAGIVHRDIKPENIMVRDDGYVKVLDFGLAKLTEAAESDPEAVWRRQIFSSPGVIMGTATYMSPEQAKGQPIDRRTDIFSLGVVLFEMLTGKTPFTGSTSADVIVAIVQEEAGLPSKWNKNIPPELDVIAAKMLQKDRAERYQQMPDLLADLRHVRKQLEPGDQVSNSHGIRPRWITGARASAGPGAFTNYFILTAAAVLLIGAAVAAYWYFR